jgi:hypothetical protein
MFRLRRKSFEFSSSVSAVQLKLKLKADVVRPVSGPTPARVGDVTCRLELPQLVFTAQAKRVPRLGLDQLPDQPVDHACLDRPLFCCRHSLQVLAAAPGTACQGPDVAAHTRHSNSRNALSMNALFSLRSNSSAAMHASVESSCIAASPSLSVCLHPDGVGVYAPLSRGPLVRRACTTGRCRRRRRTLQRARANKFAARGVDEPRPSPARRALAARRRNGRFCWPCSRISSSGDIALAASTTCHQLGCHGAVASHARVCWPCSRTCRSISSSGDIALAASTTCHQLGCHGAGASHAIP